MSLLWRDRYVAVLGHAGVSLVHRARGWGSAPQVAARADCIAEAGQPPWSAALEALAALLAQAGARRGELVIVLESHFARFRVVPWSDEIGTPEEFDAYVRICFEEIYGAEVAGWSVCASPEGAGRARLTAAIEHQLVDGLRTIAEAAGLRLVSIQPYLMAAFNRFGNNIREDDFIFAVAEPGRGTLIMRREDRWCTVRSSAGMDSNSAMTALISRECELQSIDDAMMPAIFVHAPGRAGFAPGPINGAKPRTLALAVADPSVASDPLVTMAMAAA